MNHYTHPHKFKTYESINVPYAIIGNLIPYIVGTDDWIAAGKAMQDLLKEERYFKFLYDNN